MKTRIAAAAAALLIAGGIAAPASAAINSPVPSDLYITVGQLDWAWASPCSPGGCNAGQFPLDLSYQGTQGWRVATAADFANAPTAADFGGRCAAAYFTTANYCDFGDGQTGYIWNNPNSPNPAELNADTWVVRGLDAGVPEPATWALMILGFGAVGGALRRRAKAAVRFA